MNTSGSFDDQKKWAFTADDLSQLAVESDVNAYYKADLESKTNRKNGAFGMIPQKS